MSVATLPDLNALPADALRALILTQHEQLISREREIEHLQLLLAKLHRMQFGRKSEKLQRQIEQLELRLEELESHRSEKECNAAEPASVIASSTPTATKPTRRALPDHLPRQTRRHEPKETVCPQCQGELRKTGRRCFRDAGVCARQFHGDSARAHQAELHEVRLHRAGRSAQPSDRARGSGAGTAGACAGLEVLRSLAALSAIGDVRATGCGAGALDLGRLGGRHKPVAAAAGRSTATLRDGRRQTARRRHAGAGAGAGPGQDENGAIVDLRS